MYFLLEGASRKGYLKTLALLHLIECTITGTFHHKLGNELFLTQAKKKKNQSIKKPSFEMTVTARSE